uniref:Integrase core domain containing protein n=1 Tax=Solanum tuberosum TaxID=4113 RepID=M1DCF5_SOLTU
MATLLQHMKPWIQHSIAESEARMAQMMDHKVQSAPTAPDDEAVMTSLFGDAMPPPDYSHAARKRHHSDRTSDDAEAQRLRKKERHQLEEATKASLLDEELRHQRA